MRERYDINGNDTLDIAECKNCNHQVDVKNLRGLEANGLVYGVSQLHDTINPLIVMDKISTCCDHPDYHFIEWMHVFRTD